MRDRRGLVAFIVRSLFFVAACCLLVGYGRASHARPNLAALSVEGPTRAVVGSSMSLRLEAWASSDVSTFRWAAYASTDGTLASATLVKEGVASRGTNSGEVVWNENVTVPANIRGARFFILRLDPRSEIAESNEDDNSVGSKERVSIELATPNFRVEAVDLQSTSRREGESFDAIVRVVNDGEVAASTRVTVYMSHDEAVSAGDVEVGAVDVALAARGSAVETRINCVIPVSMEVGDYRIGAIADAAQAIAERDEIDNLQIARDRLNVFRSDVAFVTRELPRGTVFIPYFARLMASGGNGHYRYSITGGHLVDGLSLDEASGVIRGTPRVSAPTTVEFGVESLGMTARATFVLSMAESGVELGIVPHDLENGTIGVSYEDGLVAAGGEPPYEWSIESGALPLGLDLGLDGAIRGRPTQEGRFRFVAAVRDARAARVSQQFEIIVDAPNVVILDGPLVPHPVGAPMEYALNASGGVRPYLWKALSAPPPGLTLSEDGIVLGTPSRIGGYAMRIQVTDSSESPRTDTATILLDVEDADGFRIETQALPEVGLRQKLDAVVDTIGGDKPFEWRLGFQSKLPAGFALTKDPDDRARITGSSVRPIAAAFELVVEDARGRRRNVPLLIRVVGGDGVGSGASDGCACQAKAAGSSTLRGSTALIVFGLVYLVFWPGKRLVTRIFSRRDGQKSRLTS